MNNKKGFLQHHLNELHVYCRLRSIGLPKKIAKVIARKISPKSLLYTKNLKENNER